MERQARVGGPVAIGASSATSVEEEAGIDTERAPAPQLRRRLGRADLRAVSESRKALRELLCQWESPDRPGTPATAGAPGTAGTGDAAGAPHDTDDAHDAHDADGSKDADDGNHVDRVDHTDHVHEVNGRNGRDGAGGPRPSHVSEVSDVAELLTSELVTNALIHTDHDAVLTATVGPGGLHVEVRDFVSRRPRLCVPDADDGTNGRGLFLVQALADAWGVRPHGVGKSVWFELGVA